jgi:hypothetical protein
MKTRCRTKEESRVEAVREQQKANLGFARTGEGRVRKLG